VASPEHGSSAKDASRRGDGPGSVRTTNARFTSGVVNEADRRRATIAIAGSSRSWASWATDKIHSLLGVAQSATSFTISAAASQTALVSSTRMTAIEYSPNAGSAVHASLG
jgi:hypothetical protein